MKVLYDHQTFELQNFGGISRYFVELLRSRAGFQVDLALKRSSNIYLKSDDRWSKDVKVREDIFERRLAGIEFLGKGRCHQLLRNVGVVLDPGRVNRKHSLKRIGNGDFDVFHPTYYDPYFLESVGDKPIVVTVFDMIHEIFPEHFFAGDLTSVHKKRLCQRAERVIAISNTTKEDLIRFLGIDEEKIDVIYLASSLGARSIHPANRILTPERFLLFTGNRFLYKNFMFFLRAIADLLLQEKDLVLVCTGPSFSTDELDYFDSLGVRDQLVHVSADEDLLGELYRKADIFVFPSLYEGFGIPLLEAFSCRCPVAASDTSIFREIGGDAIAYFQPKDPLSIKHTVRALLDDQSLSNELADRGYERNRRFSWQRTTEQSLRTYEKV